MKKILIGLVIASTMTLAGCAGRPLNQYDRAAILGASEAQALQNAHDAAYGDQSYGDLDGKPKHRHHRKNERWQQDDRRDRSNGVVYQDGVKGYYDAYGNFIAY